MGTQYRGDGDPLDVVELGGDKLPRGAVVPVKIVGALALIDEGELDWKLIAIAECDKLSTRINDIDDVEELMLARSMLCATGTACTRRWMARAKTSLLLKARRLVVPRLSKSLPKRTQRGRQTRSHKTNKIYCFAKQK